MIIPKLSSPIITQSRAWEASRTADGDDDCVVACIGLNISHLPVAPSGIVAATLCELRLSGIRLRDLLSIAALRYDSILCICSGVMMLVICTPEVVSLAPQLA